MSEDTDWVDRVMKAAQLARPAVAQQAADHVRGALAGRLAAGPLRPADLSTLALKLLTLASVAEPHSESQ